MAQDHLEQFEKNWKHFMTRLTGEIMQRSEKALPSPTQLNLLLQECVQDWGSRETQCGRWFMTYQREQPQKAGIIGKILMEDMKFCPCTEKKSMPVICQAAVPAAGFAAGLLISRQLHAGLLAQIMSAVVPTAVLVPSVRAVDEQLRERNIQLGIQEYLEQLDKYHASICAILADLDG